MDDIKRYILENEHEEALGTLRLSLANAKTENAALHGLLRECRGCVRDPELRRRIDESLNTHP